MKLYETIDGSRALIKYMLQETGLTMPDIESLRNEALFAGALDPMTLRFQIVEYDKFSGELISVPGGNLGFEEAVMTTAGLIEKNQDSHFCLQPVGFVN